MKSGILALSYLKWKEAEAKNGYLVQSKHKINELKQNFVIKIQWEFSIGVISSDAGQHVESHERVSKQKLHLAIMRSKEFGLKTRKFWHFTVY